MSAVSTGGTPEQQQPGGGTPNQPQSQSPDFTTWLASQGEDTKQLLDNHVAGLKTALSSERDARKALEAQVRDAAKKLEEGSEARKQLDQLATQLAGSTAQATFYDAAHSAGVANLKLAYLAAREAGLVDEKGACDFTKLQAQFPELFARKPAPPPANAGNGTQREAPSGGMNSFIRRAAGRNG